METAVLNALASQAAEIGYVKTDEGFEVDFLARMPRQPRAAHPGVRGPDRPKGSRARIARARRGSPHPSSR